MTMMSTHPLTKMVPAKVGTILTEHEYDTLNKMLSSRDEGDHRMAQAILNQCDVQKSIYWIWKLCKQRHTSNMVYLRTKASREFVKESSLFTISYKNATTFGVWLIDINWMTPEIYQYLKPLIIAELAVRNRDINFYEIYISIKEPFSALDPEDALTHLNTNSKL